MNSPTSSLTVRRFLGIAGVLVVGAFLLRVLQLGKEEIWFDEAVSFYVTSGPLDLGRVLAAEHTPPLYYMLLQWWVGWAGRSEAGLRMLSALFGTLFVAAIIWAGATYFNRRVGLWAGAFAMIAPVHIYYSQEARSYALLVLLVTVTGVLLWRALERQTPLAWMMATTSGILTLYTHYFAVLALLPTVTMVFMPQYRQQVNTNLRRLGSAVLICVLLYAPLLYWHLVYLGHSGDETAWIRNPWALTPPMLAIPRTLEVFWLGSGPGLVTILIKVYPLITFPDSLRVVALFLLVGLALWVGIPWKDVALQIPFLAQRKIWLVTMLFFPLLFLWLVSFYHPLYAVGRYDLVAFPAFALLVGLALAKVQSAGRTGPVLACCIALAIAGLIGFKLVQYYELPPRPMHGKPSARTTAAALLSTVRNGDLVVFTGFRGLPVLYYFSREGLAWTEGRCESRQAHRRFGCRMYPIEMEKSPGFALLASRADFSEAPRNDIQRILSPLTDPAAVIWLVSDLAGYREGQLQVSALELVFIREAQNLGYEITPTDIPSVLALLR